MIPRTGASQCTQACSGGRVVHFASDLRRAPCFFTESVDNANQVRIIIINQNNGVSYVSRPAIPPQVQRSVLIIRAGPGREKVSSAELLGPRGYLTIEHANEDYVLRVTRSGKLILNK